MKCPLCGGKTRVYKTEHVKNIIVRRRECDEDTCHYRFKTTESAKDVADEPADRSEQ